MEEAENPQVKGYFTVPIFRKGPLFVRLKKSGIACKVDGFDRDADGNPGEVEQDGRVRVGDHLVAVNDISIERKSLKEIQAHIGNTQASPNVRYFVFRRTSASSNDNLSTDANSSICTDVKPSTNQRTLAFRTILAENLINEGKLRSLAANGVPDQMGLRGLIWRILLRYLPADSDIWESVLSMKRREYAQMRSQYETPDASNVEIQDDPSDHPLSALPSSKWNSHFEDAALMEEIEKDVIRTHPDIKFFIDEQSSTQVQKILSTILFIFAKENPVIRYVQGMNDLCGTLYYVFATDESASWREHAEADAYFCFSYLIHENRDLFIRTMDETESGIHGRIRSVMELLQRLDGEVYQYLQNQGLDASFYCLRWVTTLLSREFHLPDTIRVWDCLFADTNRAEFLCYMCCTMIMEQREALLTGDFAHNLQLLQSYPPCDVFQLLDAANTTRALDFHTNDEDLEGESSWFDTAFGRRISGSSLGRLLANNRVGLNGSLAPVRNMLTSAEDGMKKLFHDTTATFSTSSWTTGLNGFSLNRSNNANNTSDNNIS